MRPAVLVTASLLAGFAVAGALRARPGPAEKLLTVDVWPGKAPGEKGEAGAENVLETRPGQRPAKRITNVTRPTLTVYRPAGDRNTGAAVLIAPGGGYNILAF